MWVSAALHRRHNANRCTRALWFGWLLFFSTLLLDLACRSLLPPTHPATFCTLGGYLKKMKNSDGERPMLSPTYKCSRPLRCEGLGSSPTADVYSQTLAALHRRALMSPRLPKQEMDFWAAASSLRLACLDVPVSFVWVGVGFVSERNTQSHVLEGKTWNVAISE